MGSVRLTLVALLVTIGGAGTHLGAQKQLKYDIKTRVADTIDLHLAKRGIIAVFNNSPLARVVNTGEDYAVWLLGVERFVNGDSMQVVVLIDVTPPALIWRKDRAIASVNPSFSYNRRRLIEYANANISEADLRTTNADFTSVAQRVSTMLTRGAETANMNVALSGVLVSGLVVGLAEAIRGNPSPVQVAESLYIGHAVLQAVETTVRGR